jgi:HD-GYP domain-containing protein (c-di-GMP phosphodiesterase class II)/pSer/pThr/pTyr-binding forkhead associated (FHA) protein
MLRFVLKCPNECGQLLFFEEDTVTIGRAADNAICLADRSVSKYHGRVYATRVGYVYEDLNSTNGTTILHGQEKISLTGKGTKAFALRLGDAIQIAGHTIRLEGAEPVFVEPVEQGEVTVMLSQPCADPARLEEDLIAARAGAASLFLRLVRETSAQLDDERRLIATVGDILFQAFPKATHLAMATREGDEDRLRPLLFRSRSSKPADHPLSRSIVGRVLREGVSLAFTRGQGSLSASESIVAANIEQAMCAPLRGHDRPFGVLELDIRASGRGVFKSDDLDLLALFASHIGLVLDNLRLYQEQQRALQSTINALVRSLSLKDPDTANHSERVRSIALLMGREIGLSDRELEVLGTASVLHDMGKHASRIELLNKPAKLTPEERLEMDEHAEHTQGVLDMIRYPEHLKDVPRIAAYHHEKMNGTGIFGLRGEEIPLLSRVIAVADVFDALVTPRPYKAAMSFPDAMATLNADCDTLWDGRVLEVVERITPEIARSVYRMDSFVLRAGPFADHDDQERAA